MQRLCRLSLKYTTKSFNAKTDRLSKAAVLFAILIKDTFSIPLNLIKKYRVTKSTKLTYKRSTLTLEPNKWLKDSHH